MIKFKSSSPFLALVFFAIIIIAGGFGWVANIVKLASVDAFSGFAMLRAIGIIVAPLGAVLGFV